MRITLLTNWDAPSALSLHYLRSQLSGHQLTVFYTRKSAPKSPQLNKDARPIELRLLSEFENSLPQLISVFEQLNALPLNNINQSGDLQQFQDSKPDLVISVRHMSILQNAAIRTPKRGVINLHSGLLPQYQGVMATFWAMRNQEKTIGTTLHFIDDSKIDAGAIIAQTHTAIEYTKSYFWNTLNLYRHGCENIMRAVQQLDYGSQLQAHAQQGSNHYYSFPTHKDFIDLPFTFFDPNDTLAEFI